jgi:hypothetical protein
MSEKLTEELLDELVFTQKIDEYVEREEVKDEFRLCDYLTQLLDDKNLKKSQVIKISMLNQTFAYEIFAGSKKPSRTKLLQIIFAMKLSFREAQRTLKYGGLNELYAKNRRDAIIIYCINNGMTLEETDETLFGFEQQTICDE